MDLRAATSAARSRSPVLSMAYNPGQDDQRQGGQVIRGNNGPNHDDSVVCGTIYVDCETVACDPRAGPQLAEKLGKVGHLTGLQMVLSLTGGASNLSGWRCGTNGEHELARHAAEN